MTAAVVSLGLVDLLVVAMFLGWFYRGENRFISTSSHRAKGGNAVSPAQVRDVDGDPPELSFGFREGRRQGKRERLPT